MHTVDQWLWLYSVQLAATGLPFYTCPLQEMEREVASLRGQLEAIEKLKYVNVHSCWHCSVMYIRTFECPLSHTDCTFVCTVVRTYVYWNCTESEDIHA